MFIPKQPEAPASCLPNTGTVAGRTGGNRFRHEDFLILLLSLAVVAIAVPVVHRAGFDMPDLVWFARNLRLYLIIFLLVVLAEIVVRLLHDRPASPVRYVLSSRMAGMAANRIASFLPVAAIALMMPAFSAMKSSIGKLNPFVWDATFIAIDKAIHGTDPWRLLQPIMGHPWVTVLSSNLYHAWFALIFLGPVLFAVFAKDRVLRLTFFLSYLATWTIVGVLFATLLSSVAPCFVGPILGNDYFAPQMAYLHAVDRTHPLAVIEVQNLLIQWYRNEDAGLGRGITAMPSMHVALAWLYVLASWRIDRRLAVGFAIFFVIIQLSSVHLAYHYAIDGYVAVFLVSIIWLLCQTSARAILGRLSATTRTRKRFAPFRILQGFRPIYQGSIGRIHDLAVLRTRVKSSGSKQ